MTGVQLFTVTHYGSLWVDTDPTPTRLRKIVKEALNDPPYAVELVKRNKRSRDVRA